MDLAAPGGVNAPADTSTADVTAVFGMISLVRLEHVGAAVATEGTSEQAAQRNSLALRGLIFTGMGYTCYDPRYGPTWPVYLGPLTCTTKPSGSLNLNDSSSPRDPGVICSPCAATLRRISAAFQPSMPKS